MPRGPGEGLFQVDPTLAAPGEGLNGPQLSQVKGVSGAVASSSGSLQSS